MLPSTSSGLRPQTRGLSGRAVLLCAGVWLLIATVVSASGAVARLRPPGPQALLFALALTLLALGAWLPAVREWRLSIDWRVFPAAHLGRAVAGGTFLLLVGRGELPRDFLQAGVGDVLVAVLALTLLMFVRPEHRRARGLYLAWNVFGLVDILLVLATGVRLGMRNPDVIAGFGRLPLALLPTFYVPIVLATHVWLFGRLWRERAGVTAATEGRSVKSDGPAAA